MWFVFPFGVRPITLWEAIGVALVVSLLTHQHQQRQKYSKDDGVGEALTEILTIFVTPITVLVIGYIVHLLS